MRGNAAEIFVNLDVPRHRVQPTTKFRSTWIVASQNALRDCGFFDRYSELVPDLHRERLMTAVVGMWLPADVAHAHYTACDRLALSASERTAITQCLVRPMSNTLFGVMGRLAKQVGMTPWTPLAYLHRLWDRFCVGGGVIIYKEGPKEARVEVLGLTLAPIPYFRSAFCELSLGVGKLFCPVLYIKELHDPKTPTTMIFRGSWV